MPIASLFCMLGCICTGCYEAQQLQGRHDSVACFFPKVLCLPVGFYGEGQVFTLQGAAGATGPYDVIM